MWLVIRGLLPKVRVASVYMYRYVVYDLSCNSEEGGWDVCALYVLVSTVCCDSSQVAVALCVRRVVAVDALPHAMWRGKEQ
jgi:hypothetical protein